MFSNLFEKNLYAVNEPDSPKLITHGSAMISIDIGVIFVESGLT